MYRVLAANQEVRERRNQLRHPPYAKPQLAATAPNQVWTWDITKLPGPAKWTYYYLSVILDIYSRYVVGWMLAHRESQQLAERLIRETVVKDGIQRDQLTIHSDRGPAMRSQAVAQLLATLGVTKSAQQTPRQRRQPLLREPVQDAEIPARLPGQVRRLRSRARLLPQVLPLAQRGALPLWNRAPDAGGHARRPSIGSPGGPSLRAGRRPCPPPRAVRARSTKAARACRQGLDQPARESAARPHTDATPRL